MSLNIYTDIIDLQISPPAYFTDQVHLFHKENSNSINNRNESQSRRKRHHSFKKDYDDDFETKWSEFPLDMMHISSDRQIVNELNEKFRLSNVLNNLKKKH